MKMFFAGSEYIVFAKALQEAGVKNILESAYYLDYKHPPNELNFPGYVLDSGGFSARNLGVPTDVKVYAEFLNKFQVKVAFNLDTLSVEETLANQKFLEKMTKTYIIPVYHFSEFKTAKWRDLLFHYRDNYPYIAFGGTAEGATGITNNKIRFFDWCFAKIGTSVRVHGLAVTSQKLIMRYPFYSVDSTSWVSGERFGQFYQFDGMKLKQSGSIRVLKGDMSRISNPRQISTDQPKERLENIRQFLKLEQFTTELWKKRGIVWEDFTHG